MFPHLYLASRGHPNALARGPSFILTASSWGSDRLSDPKPLPLSRENLMRTLGRLGTQGHPQLRVLNRLCKVPFGTWGPYSEVPVMSTCPHLTYLAL